MILMLFLTLTAYEPVRVELYVTQLKTTIREQKRELEKKLASTKEHQERAGRRAILPKRLSRFSVESLLRATESVIDTLEATITSLDQQLRHLDSVKLGAIKNKKDEDTLMRKLELERAVADMKNRIDHIERTERYIDEEKKDKPTDEKRALDKLKLRLGEQRRSLLRKLTSEQERLAQVVSR